MQDVEGLSID